MSEALTRRIAKELTGHSYDDVANACVNLLANALRQKHTRWDAASEELDDMARRAKDALRKDYGRDGVRRNHIILRPHPELIEALGRLN